MSRASLLLALLATLLARPVAAETVTAAVAPARVSISSTFSGVEATVFGTIAPDPGTPPPARGWDVVVTLSGPNGTLVVRRKERIAGLWINRDRRRFDEVPLYSAVAATRPLADLTDAATAERLGLGRRIGETSVDADDVAFRRALHRLEAGNGAWRELPTGVSFLGDRLFAARIPIPAEAPIGIWRARVEVFADGVPVAAVSVPLTVAKSGFDRRLAELATRQPIAYGLIVVMVSLLTGWLGGVLFRRD